MPFGSNYSEKYVQTPCVHCIEFANVTSVLLQLNHTVIRMCQYRNRILHTSYLIFVFSSSMCRSIISFIFLIATQLLVWLCTKRLFNFLSLILAYQIAEVA